MILRWTQHLLLALYCAAPVLAVLLAIVRVARGRRSTGGGLAFTCSAAIIMGCALTLAVTIAAGARIRLGQIALTVYLLAALMFVLRGFDGAVVWILRRMWDRVFARAADSESAAGHASRPSILQRLATPVPSLVRAALLILFGIPYLIAVAMVYRPKVISHATPETLLNVGYDDAQLATDDGMNISAWWIRAPSARETERTTGAQSKRAQGSTVILCHGFASGKAAMLPLAQPLLAAGYNVLVFDFRAHGQSDGQLTSLGMNERLDVLAAVRWLQTNRPKQARRIVGLGVSSGAAALIAAAADPSPQGQAIEAIAVYEGYDSLPGLARTIAHDRFLPPLKWVADRVALAIASAHVGADLLHFSPAEEVKQLWPRPLLVIHGGIDQVVPFEHGERLFDAADGPRRSLWLPMDDYARALEDKGAVREVLYFFNEARPVPAI